MVRVFPPFPFGLPFYPFCPQGAREPNGPVDLTKAKADAQVGLFISPLK